jgi:puromycin-sensitive aminopeptidase
LHRYREKNATADDFWRELSVSSGRDVGAIANAWIKQPGHPLIRIASARHGSNLQLTLRQERFYADPKSAAGTATQLWPVPLVIKYGTKEGVREQRVLFEASEATVTLSNADWIYPNGDGSGFYRFALDDAALDALVAAIRALSPQERLALVGNQWALVKAGAVSIAQFFSLLEGLRGESDRAVLGAVTERLGWIRTHVVSDETRGDFERIVAGFYDGQLQQLGWDPRPYESTDDRLRRAIVIGALGDLARAPAVLREARARLERYWKEPTSLDPNLVSVVVGLAALAGDPPLYDRYLESKHAAAADPEEEQRFLFGLTAFEDTSLAQRTLGISITDEVRVQDRAHVFARMLGNPATRMATWRFVRDRWDDLIREMDPMLQQNLVRGLAQLTAPDVANQVHAFLRPRATAETRETVEQALEQLTIDAAACARLTPELRRVLGPSRS